MTKIYDWKKEKEFPWYDSKLAIWLFVITLAIILSLEVR